MEGGGDVMVEVVVVFEWGTRRDSYLQGRVCMYKRVHIHLDQRRRCRQ